MNHSKIIIEFEDNEIILDKTLSINDEHVLDFSGILAKNNIRYVLFSRYIPILFGNNETSEEIDFLIQKISFEKFLKLWLEIENTYECKNTQDPIDAYNAYLKNHHVVRIVKKENQIPEFRIKIIKYEMDRFTLKYRKKVILGDRILFISPFEMQIPFNLFRGTQEDIEDAKFLYGLSKGRLNMRMIERLLNELKIPKESFDMYLHK